MDDLGCAMNHVLSCRRKARVSSFVCDLLFFRLFALILHIFDNFTYVKFTFALFQGQIAACNTCITVSSR